MGGLKPEFLLGTKVVLWAILSQAKYTVKSAAMNRTWVKVWEKFLQVQRFTVGIIIIEGVGKLT